MMRRNVLPVLFLLPCFLVFMVLLPSCQTQNHSQVSSANWAKVSAGSIAMLSDTMAASFRPDPWDTTSNDRLISGVVRLVIEDSRGHLWFGTQNGLCRYDGAQLIYYDLRDGFGDRVVVRALAEDATGDLWIGYSAGLARYDGEFFTFFPIVPGEDMATNEVWTLHVDHDGIVWAATLNGLYQFDGAAYTRFPLPSSTKRDPNMHISSPDIVWDIMQDRTGALWLAGEGDVHVYDGKDLTRFPVTDQDSHTFVRGILEDRSGTLWFATSSKGLIRLDGDTFTNVTREHNLQGTEVGGLYEDRAGNIWFTSENHGIYRFDGQTYTNFSQDHGLDIDAPFSVMEDRKGRIWGVGMGGAYRYDGEAFVPVTRDGPW